MTQASLVNNNKNNIDLVLNPIKNDCLITEASINALIEISEYNNLLKDDSSIKNAVAELNSVLKPLQENMTGREIRYQVLARKDATIQVSIDKDEMTASAEITTAFGGKHLTAKAILNAAQQAGVNKGFSKENLIKLAQKAAKELPGTIVSQEVAFGKTAINGKDAKIKHLVESAQSRILKPKKLNDGSNSVDMKDLGDIICVKIGDPLVQRVPLTDGIKGYTVTGNSLEPTPGEDVPINAGEGTTISPNDENILLSALVGLPRIIDNGMEVDEIYTINNVDISTGHIKFEGSVIILGDVCEGMKVIATGDINIGGFVESALLEAGGDITIGSGIIGRKQDEEQDIHDMHMSSSINAKGTVFAKYAQYAEISCRDLRIENQLMHSMISVKNTLWIGSEEKANGKLIGGHINIGTSIHAGIIGATAGSKISIGFTEKVDIFNERISDLDVLAQAESDKTSEMQIAIKKLKSLPKEKTNPAMLTKVVSTYKHHAKRMGEVLNEKERVEHEKLVYMASVYVQATERIYPGVEMTVGEFHDRSRREYGPTKMIYKERKIHFDPIIHS